METSTYKISHFLKMNKNTQRNCMNISFKIIVFYDLFFMRINIAIFFFLLTAVA